MSQRPLAKCDKGHVLARAETRGGAAGIAWSESVAGLSLRPEHGGLARGRFNEAEHWVWQGLPIADTGSQIAYCRACRHNYDLNLGALARILALSGSPIVVTQNEH